jgi:hypothetical protein
MYSYLVIDPRSAVVPPNTLGIEVTDPRIALLCDLGNLDPQHGFGRLPTEYLGNAACDAALAEWLPPAGASLATIRPDLDSVAAMAVLSLRAAGWQRTEEVDRRVTAVALADAHVTSGAWQPRPLPTPDQPWGGGGPVEDRRELAAAHIVAQDRDLTLQVRVAVIAAWLLGGEEPSDEKCMTALRACITSTPDAGGPEMVRTILSEARERAERARWDLVASLSPTPSAPHPMDSFRSSHVHPPRMTAVEREGIAVVQGSHAGAIGVGYCLAPIVVAMNPAFRWPSGPTTAKATVAFYRSPGVDTMRRLAERLNREEAAALCDEADRLAAGGGGCFVRVGSDGLESAAHAIRQGQTDTARAILLAATGQGWVDEAWVAAQRTRILDLIGGRGWGGNFVSGILGSPQGVDTALSAEQIAEIVREVAR